MPAGKKTNKSTPKKSAAKKSTARKPAAKKPPAKKTAAKVPVAKSGAAPERKHMSNEIKGIIVVALGIFAGVVFFMPSGIIGGAVKQILLGLFGGAAMISFLFIILTGINLFLDKRTERMFAKLLLLLGILILTSAICCLYIGDTSFNAEKSFFEQVADMYSSGSAGGVFGGVIAKTLTRLLGEAGAWIFSVAAELIFIILITGVSVSAICKRLALRARNETKRAAAAAKRRREERELSLKNNDMPRKKKPIDFSVGEEKSEASACAGEPEPEKFKFTFEKDDSVLDDVIPDEDAISDEDLPFELADITAGILTALPNEDGTSKRNTSDDPLDFEPPSEAQMQDKLDPATREALERGIPLDMAVTEGRKLAMSGEVNSDNPPFDIGKEKSGKPQIIRYSFPTVDLLDTAPPQKRSREEIRSELEEKANRLLETLRSFKVDAKIINITQGPSVTRFELQPAPGVKVSKITGLADDIALSLAARNVRIEAPIPGKAAIGIEIPNKNRSVVPIRDVIDTDKFRRFNSKTAFALGKDITGNTVIADIAKFPHVLIAGATGSGKSVCINSLIVSILYKAKPDEVKLIMIDPKKVELGMYNGIPHLLIPVVTDPKHAAGALNWAVSEMKNRYNLFEDNKVRNLKGFNELVEKRGEPELKLPEIVIIIDELADLMLAAKSEVEDAINSLAALARAAGMYLVIATQRPSVDVITGVIKANVPSRIAFATSSQVDSRTIIDTSGAEKLLGLGDMLYNPRGEIKPTRIQGNFVSDAEIEDVIEYIKSQYEAEYDEEIMESIEKEHERVATDTEAEEDERSGNSQKVDALFLDAVELVLENGQASVAMFQRKFKIGYQRAARLIDQMEERRIIGPYEGTKPRQVLISRSEFNEMRMNFEIRS